MPTTLPNKKPGGYHRQSAGAAIESGLLVATLLVALAFCIATSLLPAQLVLPALSLIVLICGLMLGAAALVARSLRGHANERMLDIAGVLVLFGFAVAIICDKSEAVRLLSGLPAL